jgi:anti-sigma factor RsiW
VNNMTDCQHVRQLLGVYVVGAIDPAERFVVDNHLAECPDCREELAGLAGLPALLGRVPLEEAEQIAGFDSERATAGERQDAEPAEAEVLTPLLAEMAHRRRVSRWRSLASVAAAVLVAAGAALGAVRLANPPSASLPAVAWDHAQATSSVTHDQMQVKYAAMPGGTQLVVKASGIPVGTTCQLWVMGPGGTRWPAGSWTVTGGWQAVSYHASSAAPRPLVRGFQLTSGHALLVSVRAS